MKLSSDLRKSAEPVEVDGLALDRPAAIPLVDDGGLHHVRVVLG